MMSQNNLNEIKLVLSITNHLWGRSNINGCETRYHTYLLFDDSVEGLLVLLVRIAKLND
jgi:hypothetical protein